MRWLIGVLAAAVLLAPASLAQDQADTRRVQVTLQDEGCPAGPDRFCVQPSEITVDEGRTLVLEVENRGHVRHNLTAAGSSPRVLAEAVDVAPLPPNGSTEVTLTWETLESASEDAGSSQLVLACGFDGHEDLGERLTLQIGEDEEQPQPGFGAWAALAAVGLACAIGGRAKRGG